MSLNINLISSAIALYLLQGAAQAIVGGVPVNQIDEAPFIVRTANSCAGVILSDSWILTAAHCKHTNVSVVFAGRTDISDTLGGYPLNDTNYAIEYSIVHPEYKKESFQDENDERTDIIYNDLMLVRTYRKMKFSDRIQPIEISAPQELTNQTLTVYGWGDTFEGNQEVQKQLMKAEIPFVSLEVANRDISYHGMMKDWAHIIAGVEDGSVDACNGDSGGPLVIRKDEKSLLVGIVSGGKGCGRANKFGIYANAMNLKPWIEKTMNDNTFKSSQGEIWLNGKKAILVVKNDSNSYDYIKLILQKETGDVFEYENLGTGDRVKLNKDMKSAKVQVGRKKSVWIKNLN